MRIQSQTFKQFLEETTDLGSYTTDDIIHFILPLFREVLTFHEIEKVGPFGIEDALFITNDCLDIDENLIQDPKERIQRILAMFESKHSHFDVIGNLKMDTDVDKGIQTVENLNIHFDLKVPIKYPAYIPGYQCFEQLLDHHDAQTDIFCLGLILGSITFGLDLYDKEDLKVFLNYRSNPANYNNKIHPTICTLITEMTELNRAKRTQDLYDVIHRLEHYRDYDPERQSDLSNIPGWISKNLSNQNDYILNKLRNRLFDTSRRNRLLYYKPNMRFVNLTASSVPMVVNFQSIRPDLLFTWNDEIAGKVKGMNEILLNKYLRFEDHNYLPSSLDKIRVESQRDEQEFGFSQLKLVIAFLNWHNLKEDQRERIQSPLLLIPVKLKKNKKLKEDHYVLEIVANEAEVNPVLANQLKDLYGIKLPDMIDLDDICVSEFYNLLKGQVDGANQGITLQLIDKPRIKFIQSIAKQTISNYRKRIRRSNGVLDSYKNIGYSYQTETYKPLGLEIFKQRIQQRSTFLEFLINDDIKITSNHLTTSSGTKERKLFEMVESEQNPYSWDFDICNIVLGNFNYKKMSLVRDYNSVIDNKIQHKVFSELFSSQPKQQNDFNVDLNSLNDWYHVITSDPTQTKAVLQSRQGESYIIQGPPGTGKSQTITNLIADFAARGKKVLFVCEKRAALDVVYHRLKQQGLDELCCYIHDSQGDKREFIQNLKTTYEDFVKNKLDLNTVRSRREELLQKINKELDLISHFHFTHSSIPGKAGIVLRKLIERIVELKEHVTPLQPKDVEMFPHYEDWIQFGDKVTELSKALEETGADAAFAEHPFSKVKEAIFEAENPATLLDEKIRQAQELLDKIISVVNEYNIPDSYVNEFDQLKNMAEDAQLLYPLTISNNLKLLDLQDPRTIEFDRAIDEYKQQNQKYEEAKHGNANWKNKFTEQDVSNALSIANKYEKSLFRFFNGSWKNLKKTLEQSYDFSKHQVKPSVVNVLEKLNHEYELTNALSQTRKVIEDQYRITNLDSTYADIEKLRQKLDDKEIQFMLKHNDGNRLVKSLKEITLVFSDLENCLEQCLYDYKTISVYSLKDEMESLMINIDGLPELLPALRSYATISSKLKQALRSLPISAVQTEATLANKTYNSVCQENKKFSETDHHLIENAVRNIQAHYKKMLRLNADYIRANVRHKFLAHLEISNLAPSQLSNEQKQFKKEYNEGRKILENEFSKSMRYKSIRELTGKESGLVLKDLKPVWLMSPLSVSDSIPLGATYFDAIIFDEASQITLEEGIPSLYRAPQTIIVGDDKQMPPSNFFTTKSEDPDDLEIDDEEGELLSNDADSLLAQGARKMSSVMLGWHYRSRYETLISYSNHAFYNGSLLTIPDKTIHHTEKPEITVTKSLDAVANVNAVFDRSISYHYLQDGLYEKRANLDEADYIALLVRELLNRNVPESVGIVAFSQEQQNTIEDALTKLASEDKQFEHQLELAYNRTDEDQFVGLFVKNLENVQGDERDIIIMSVCYGFDRKKKMIMNFGPINKKGGEKRLNVIFSRAKKHMAVVSSIKHLHIKNEYNEGANYFKNFLHYAELVSQGNLGTASTILDKLVADKSNKRSDNIKSVVIQQIKAAITKEGYEVAENVGQSGFKCSLGVKEKKEDNSYTLGIMIDDEKHYSNDNILEQYYQRPAVLQSFGWRIVNVFAKDWLHNPQSVLNLILKRIHEEPALELIEEEQDFLVETPIELTENKEDKKEVKSTVPQNTALQQYGDLKFERLVCKDDTSNKFWEVAISDNKLIICFGRIGTKGQTQIKTFGTTELAEKEKGKLVREKMNKGYNVES